ncbi:MAG: SCP2 sterol-binding domain-containing protein [Gammaproteobacteria bacterium]|nr:SCP2 sterol-binding domain-containing protein [Gammaproteobacteria bacterium]
MDYWRGQCGTKADYFPGKQSIIQFKFNDLKTLNNWWLVVRGCNVEICLESPSGDVDVYLATDLKTMIECWMGERSYKSAIAEKRMNVVGPSALTRNIREWIVDSVFADLPLAFEI